jgi:hypothetical protein
VRTASRPLRADPPCAHALPFPPLSAPLGPAHGAVLVLALLFTLILTGLATLLPAQLAALRARMAYYLFGPDPSAAARLPSFAVGVLTNASASGAACPL